MENVVELGFKPREFDFRVHDLNHCAMVPPDNPVAYFFCCLPAPLYLTQRLGLYSKILNSWP